MQPFEGSRSDEKEYVSLESFFEGYLDTDGDRVLDNFVNYSEGDILLLKGKVYEIEEVWDSSGFIPHFVRSELYVNESTYLIVEDPLLPAYAVGDEVRVKISIKKAVDPSGKMRETYGPIYFEDVQPYSGRGSLYLEVETDDNNYEIGREVHIRLVLVNLRDQDVTLKFPTSRQAMFYVYDSSKRVIESEPPMGTYVTTTITIDAKSSRVVGSFDWNQTLGGSQAPLGEYTIFGTMDGYDRFLFSEKKIQIVDTLKDMMLLAIPLIVLLSIFAAFHFGLSGKGWKRPRG